MYRDPYDDHLRRRAGADGWDETGHGHLPHGEGGLPRTIAVMIVVVAALGFAWAMLV